MKDSIFYNVYILPRKIILGSIRLYQRTLSLDHGPLRRFRLFGCCKFHPTCSQYAYGAVEEFGIIRGLLLACRRVFRCTPWSDGGIDEVPKRK